MQQNGIKGLKNNHHKKKANCSDTYRQSSDLCNSFNTATQISYQKNHPCEEQEKETKTKAS